MSKRMNLNFTKTPFGSVLSMPSLDALNNAYSDYKRKSNIANGFKYFGALKIFLNDCQTYADDFFQSKHYKEDLVAQTIFTLKEKKGNAYIEYLKMALYASRQYVLFLKKHIARRNIRYYDAMVWNLMCDYERLFVLFELYVKKTCNDDVMFTKGYVNRSSPRRIWDGILSIQYLDLFPSISGIDFNAVTPCSVLLIRQHLEFLGKGIIGYQSIKDSTGRMMPKFTQVAWEFLKEAEKNLILISLIKQRLFSS